MSFKFKILSIDGGGIRGIIPAIILAEIEKRTGKRISQLFDLIAGTSTGGMLVLGLTKPNPENAGLPHYTAEELIEFYRQHGKRIFFETFLEKLIRIDDLFFPKYSSKGREEVFTELLGNTPLTAALKEVFITSYDTELRMPVFFTSKPERENTQAKSFRKICNGFTMTEAAMATSAAPTFFPPYLLPTRQADPGFYTLVDGGVFANNPTSMAIMEAIIASKKAGEKLELEEILVVSMGTGSLTRKYTYESIKHWGMFRWVRPVISITLDGQSEAVACHLEQLLPEAEGNPKQYYRFQELLTDANDDLDDASPENIVSIKKLAQKIIADRNADLDELCEQLLVS